MKNLLVKNAEIFAGDRFITGDILVRDGIIKSIGHINRGEISSSDDIIYLDRNTVLPSFFDSHTHFISYAISLNSLYIEDCRSVGEIKTSITSFIRNHSSEIIYGRGWSKSISNKQIPTRDDIDEVSEDRIVFLESKDSHSVILNSRALKYCNITENTQIDQGIIERDSKNRLNGLLAEDAVKLTKPLYDRLYNLDEKEYLHLINRASKRLSELGISSIFNVEGISSTNKIINAIEKNMFHQNFFSTVPDQEIDQMDKLRSKDCIRGVKCFMDGALGNLEASMLEPYLNNNDYSGALLKDHESLITSIKNAHGRGLPIIIHAIGDRANKTALDALKETGTCTGPYPDRIEHGQLLFPGFSSSGYPGNIVFSMQPSHLLTDIKPIERFWGRKRAEYAFAFNMIHSNGNKIIFSTDCPIEKPDPLYGIYAAVNRRDKDNYPDKAFMPEQALTIEKAIACYTTIPHRIYGFDNTIREGNKADFIIYNTNIPFDSLKYEDLGNYRVIHSISGR